MTTERADWTHTAPPYMPDRPFLVWLDDGSVRTVAIVSRRDASTLWFKDCWHPLQNAICGREHVRAWKFKEQA